MNEPDQIIAQEKENSNLNRWIAVLADPYATEKEVDEAVAELEKITERLKSLVDDMGDAERESRFGCSL